MAGRVPSSDLFGQGVLLRLGRRGLDLIGVLLGQTPVACINLGLDFRIPLEQIADPSVFTTVWSCIRPGRNAPVHSVRPRSSVTTVAFLVFCRILPDTKARRPGLFAFGRRTRTSVPSSRTSTPSAAA